MTVATVAGFLDTLRQLGLLEPTQRKQLDALQQQFTDLKALGQELIQRGWLTSFQANQLAKGKGQDLVLDQYVLLDLLGQGGMGAVFKARQSRMKRLVALKIIRKENLNSPTAVQRFLREIEAAARMSHPNVVMVFDSGQARGVHFPSMEYVEGTDLARLVKQSGPLPVADACDYIRQAALGLQHAFERGLVHRDIKPHNLMLTRQGIVKLMDLGLARVSRSADAADISTGLTSTGAVMGTPDYIAPEQAMNAKGVDIRADIYSLGCTLYHLLTGRTPFSGESLTEKLLKHQLHEPEPVESLRDGVPASLAAVLRAMMAKQPEHRYQQPRLLAAALEPFAGRGSSTMSIPEASRSGVTVRPQALVETLPPPARAGRPGVNQEAVETLPVGPRPASRKQESATAPERSRPKGKRKLLLAVGVLGLLVLTGLALRASLSSSTSQASVAKNDAPSTVVSSVSDTKVVTLPVPPTTQVVPPTTKTIIPSPPPEPQPLPGKEYLTNSIGMKLVKIPAGKFTMGSPETEKDRHPNEGPQHEVEITRAFWMGVYDVTQEEYQKVMGSNPSLFTPTNPVGEKHVVGQETRRFPVESVSWDDAVEFCRKLSVTPEEKKAGRVYRLPTEAEWEYACRAGTTTVFHFGDSLSAGHANCNSDYPGNNPLKDRQPRTTRVGSFPPNSFGLYDMHGNVWQWCADRITSYTKEAQKDPQGPTSGRDRVLRGGSFSNTGSECRASFRDNDRPDSGNFRYGFRVVFAVSRTLPPPQAESQPLPGREYLTNSIGLKLVKIPAGKFLMGSPETEKDRRPHEGPQHEVQITRSFWMGVYDVTQEEYQKVMGNNPSMFAFGPNADINEQVAGLDTRRFPVEGVFWDDAVKFCRKLSEMPQEKNASRAYRLPTEAEWEYACRAGTTSVFHFGDSLSSTQANFTGDFPYGNAAKGVYLKRTTTVGSYLPNAFGLYDMHGNVFQWCADWWGPYTKEAQKDPQGPQSGTAGVLRGGSWGCAGFLCRAASRHFAPRGEPPISSSFRVVFVAAGTP